jgi:cyclohexyl-isocyanide hydratase
VRGRLAAGRAERERIVRAITGATDIVSWGPTGP